jgi:hypothetical protein
MPRDQGPVREIFLGLRLCSGGDELCCIVLILSISKSSEKEHQALLAIEIQATPNNTLLAKNY